MKYRLRSVLLINVFSCKMWIPQSGSQTSGTSSSRKPSVLPSGGSGSLLWTHVAVILYPRVSQWPHSTNKSPSSLGCQLLLDGTLFIFMSLFSNEWTHLTYYLHKMHLSTLLPHSHISQCWEGCLPPASSRSILNRSIVNGHHLIKGTFFSLFLSTFRQGQVAFVDHKNIPHEWSNEWAGTGGATVSSPPSCY